MVRIRQPPVSLNGLPGVSFLPRTGAETWVDVMDIADLRARGTLVPMWKAHRIEFYMLMVVTDGHGRHMVDFEHYPVRPGCLVHVAAHQIHQFDRDGVFDAFLVLFVPTRLDIKVPLANWPAVAAIPRRDFDLVESLVRVMYEVGHERVSATAPRVRPELLRVVLEISQSALRESTSGDMRPSDPELEAFDALVTRSLAKQRELSWYAKKLGTSARTLTRRCQRLAGIGAKEYIDRRVVLEAKRALVHTDLTVETVGFQLGFSEATNFVKFFKRNAGTTPAKFRKSYE